MTEESLWSKTKKKKKVKRKVPKDVSMAEANDIADEETQSYSAEEMQQVKRVEAEVMVQPEEKPKSVVPTNPGPAPRKGDVWLENDGKRTFMYRGHNVRPGSGVHVSEKSLYGLQRFIDASKKSSS